MSERTDKLVQWTDEPGRLTPKELEELEARMIALREKDDTQLADDWVKKNGGW